MARYPPGLCDQRADGREAAGQLISYIHENAFDARPELKNLLTDTGKAAIEADFASTHTSEFAGIAPTGPRSAGPLLGYLRPARRSDQRAAHLLPHEPADRATHPLSQPAIPSSRRVPE
jgi:hypothetical protein